MANRLKSSANRSQAVALQYSQQDQLPRIVAHGAGEIARQIIELAKQHNIPIRQNEDLVEMLAKLDVGACISPESYRLVAEIVSFLYHTDKEWREKRPHLDLGAPLNELEQGIDKR